MKVGGGGGQKGGNGKEENGERFPFSPLPYFVMTQGRRRRRRRSKLCLAGGRTKGKGGGGWDQIGRGNKTTLLGHPDLLCNATPRLQLAQGGPTREKTGERPADGSNNIKQITVICVVERSRR